MADLKISALTASTTPLAGTEVLPIVQSGTTKQVSVANLTAGRAISAASVTASTGNFVVGTSGQGIDFSATPGTGTSELLADYEEGTWTPNQGAGLVVIGAFSSSGFYTKVGRTVTVNAILFGATSIACTAGGVITTNLPFTGGAAGTGIGNVISNAWTSSSVTIVSGATLYSGTAVVATPYILLQTTFNV